MSANKVIIIGSGIAGLSASCYLAQAGYAVTLLEKNPQAGGRAGIYQTQGFTFDMGPSWYWMPDVFERFFNDFNYTTSDLYDLRRLDPSYRVFDKAGAGIDIPADMQALEQLFEQYEPGSSARLRQFLSEAAFKYETGINRLVYKPGLSLLEYLDPAVLKGMLKLDVLTDMSKHIRRFVSHPFLIELLEFPVLFLGALPQHTPALYSLMNYADMALGTWYPMGGMHRIVQAMQRIAQEQGVKIVLNEEVTRIETQAKRATRVHTKSNTYEADLIIGAADYQHVEQHLLDKPARQYDAAYWDKRKMAPSSLLYYVGLNTKLQDLRHHNLFFDEDFTQHANDIYRDPQWPEKPLFYACVPSITDASVAPAGCENLFLLIPVAPDLQDDAQTRDIYFNLLMDRLEARTGQSIRPHVLFTRSYAHSDFINDYHAFKGNAYGLANTLSQTAILKPRMKSRKLDNLYYTGQLTVPGPGVPPSIISGKVVATLIAKEHPICGSALEQKS